MADKLYKMSELIDLNYQAPNKQSGLGGVVAEIYNPSKANVGSVALVEVTGTGTYCGAFTPNAVGTWQVIMHKSDGDGQVAKSFSVGAHNVHSVGEAVGAVNTSVGGVQTTVNGIDTNVDSIRGEFESGGLVVEIDTKLDSINNKVSALDTPPMAF